MGAAERFGIKLLGNFSSVVHADGAAEIFCPTCAVAGCAVAFASTDHIKIITIAFAEVVMHVYTSCRASLWGWWCQVLEQEGGWVSLDAY